MNAKNWSLAALVCLVAAFVTLRSFAAEEAAKPATATPGAADMEAMMKLNAPGPQHAMLAKYAGQFTADVQMWMDPSAPPMHSTGKLEQHMALNGRYLMGDYKGEMMGKPFTGMACTGYDNMKKKYFSAWIDEMSTGVMMVEGEPDASGKVVTMTGEMACPMNSQMIKMRQVMSFVDDDTLHIEMYAAMPGAKEAKSMDLTYKRVK